MSNLTCSQLQTKICSSNEENDASGHHICSSKQETDESSRHIILKLAYNQISWLTSASLEIVYIKRSVTRKWQSSTTVLLLFWSSVIPLITTPLFAILLQNTSINYYFLTLYIMANQPGAPTLSIEWGIEERAWVACLRTQQLPSQVTASYIFKNKGCIEELARLMEANNGNALQNALPNIFEGNNPAANIYNQLFREPEDIFLATGGGYRYHSKRGKIADNLVDAGRFLQGKVLSQGE
jgi:hypothetical protein